MSRSILPTLRLTLLPQTRELMDQIRRFYHVSDGMGLLAPDDQEIFEVALIALAERALIDWPEGWAVQVNWVRARDVERERAKLAAMLERVARMPRGRRVIRLRRRREEVQADGADHAN